MPKKRDKLLWSNQPQRAKHPVLGPMKKWVSRDRVFFIEQFTHATGRFVAMEKDDNIEGGKLLGDFGSLQAAKRACEEARKNDDLFLG